MRGNRAILLSAAACLALAACSSLNEAKKEEKKEAKAVVPETAPGLFKVNFDTSKGPVVVEVHRDWAPAGVDHFYTLVKLGYYDGNRFFRYVRGFVVQFGISGDAASNRMWANANIKDDPVKQHNVRGTLVYAKMGPDTRATQLFINLRNNLALDRDGFAPFGKVVEGMDVVDRLYSGYGEMAPRGEGPDAQKIEVQGNDYLANRFPRLDYIKKATVE